MPAVSASAATTAGPVRELNEDSLLARTPAFLVADGMGGHARGEVASSEAVRVVDERLDGSGPLAPEEVLAAVSAANDAVCALSAASDSGSAVAGTTLTGVVRVVAGDGGEHWMVVNVGDSRVYTWDGRRLAQLSVDHSAVQELLAAGRITPEEAAVHPERHVITRALGAAPAVEPDVWLVPVAGAQTFLVCSDGLCDGVDDAAIARILAGDEPDASGRTVAESLVAAAVAGGSRDNITAVVVESVAAGPVAEPESTRDRAPRGVLEDTRPRG